MMRSRRSPAHPASPLHATFGSGALAGLVLVAALSSGCESGVVVAMAIDVEAPVGAAFSEERPGLVVTDLGAAGVLCGEETERFEARVDLGFACLREYEDEEFSVAIYETSPEACRREELRSGFLRTPEHLDFDLDAIVAELVGGDAIPRYRTSPERTDREDRNSPCGGRIHLRARISAADAVPPDER